MNNPVSARDLIGMHQRFQLTCPLWVAELENGLLRDANSLRPYRWQVLEERPPQILVCHVTEYCNASCSFCCYRFSKPQNRMSNEVFCKAAQEYYDMGGRNIELNALTGEPLMDPLILEKIAFLRSLGSFDSSGFTTNGILLNKDEVVESLINSGLSFIRVSTSGFDKATYERVMGVKRYDEFLSGLCKLMKRNAESGNKLLIEINVRGLLDEVETEDFSNKVLPLMESSKGRVKLEFLRLYTDWIGQVKAEDLPRNCGFQGSHIKTKPCSLSFNLGVLANGDLRLCHCQFGRKGRVDDLTLGNIMNDHMADMWFSEATKKVRRTTYGRNANETCRECRTYMPINHRII